MFPFLQIYSPLRSDFYIKYTSIGSTPAVSKYCHKIKNKNVMYNKQFRNW